MWKSIAAALAFSALVPVRAAALETDELLSLVAMPLAVAAVSEITDVPVNDLVDVVSLMNDADVPPQQFIEVVRYVPVALVVEPPEGPEFVEFVRIQETAGIRGPALVTVIEERLRDYDVDVVNLRVDRPRAFDVTENFIPPVVRTRVEQARTSSHPHGGPPGQLKKQRGVQTGAEIVHGTVARSEPPKRSQRPRRVVNHDEDRDRAARVTRSRADDDDRSRGNKKSVRAKSHGRGDDHDRGNRGGGHGKGKGKGNGKGNGKGKG